MTTPTKLDTSALEAMLEKLADLPFSEEWRELGVNFKCALYRAAPALFAAVRERDALKAALEKAGEALAPFACKCPPRSCRKYKDAGANCFERTAQQALAALRSPSPKEPTT